MTPLLLDINAPEFVLLLVIAVILFGPERLPDLARKAARLLRYLRTIAGNAQQQLSKELGPEFENVDLRDLHPRAFVQKHLLDDVEPIIADVKAEVSEAGRTINNSSADITETINSADSGTGVHESGTNGRPDGGASPGGASNGRGMDGASRALTPFDLEAT
jgi:sec-independent protein translocase protein TatB